MQGRLLVVVGVVVAMLGFAAARAGRDVSRVDVPDAGREGRADPRRDVGLGPGAARGPRPFCRSRTAATPAAASTRGSGAIRNRSRRAAHGRSLRRPGPRSEPSPSRGAERVEPGGEATLSRSDRTRPDLRRAQRCASFDAHTVSRGAFDIAALSAIVACSFRPARICRAGRTSGRLLDLAGGHDAQRLHCADRELGVRRPFECGDVAGAGERVVRGQGQRRRGLPGGRDRGREGCRVGGRAGLVRALRITSIPRTRTRSGGRSRARSRSGRR